MQTCRTYDIDRIDQRDDALVERLSRRLGERVTRYHRAEVRGLERVPEGPALFVANHNGGLWTPDTWLLCAALCRRHGVEGVPYGLGHEVVLGAPIFNQILVPLGGVRAAHEPAMRLFAAGRKVLVYPGGDFDSMRPFRRRDEIVFGGRRGYMRLALRTASCGSRCGRSSSASRWG
jgi:1-acyl-sn-glycerol-3-phosphate acyltransferase